jgi:nucleotide-binding universal stress UspA family protein
MYKTILIATDGSALSEKAVRQGLALAQALQAKATIVTVTEPWAAVIVGEAAVVFPPADYERTAAATAAKILDGAKTIAAEMSVACDTLHITERQPAEGIIEAAEEKGSDLIVMASHGRRGLSRMVLGSETNEVVTHSKVPVLVCR